MIAFQSPPASFFRYQQYIGRVTSAVLATGGQRKRVYVGTDTGAVAALNLRKGDIGECCWALNLRKGDIGQCCWALNLRKGDIGE